MSSFASVDLADFDLKEVVTEAFDQATEKGMKLPFLLCAISPNGSVIVLRVRGDGSSPDVLAEHIEQEGWQLPMTLAVFDQNNESIRIAITAKRKAEH
jgi:hypothetical protein